jgi:hypothetical protein
VASSMASWAESCQQAGGESLERLVRFRRELYWCLWRCPDALFELADAVLTAPGLTNRDTSIPWGRYSTDQVEDLLAALLLRKHPGGKANERFWW